MWDKNPPNKRAGHQRWSPTQLKYYRQMLSRKVDAATLASRQELRTATAEQRAEVQAHQSGAWWTKGQGKEGPRGAQRREGRQRKRQGQEGKGEAEEGSVRERGAGLVVPDYEMSRSNAWADDQAGRMSPGEEVKRRGRVCCRKEVDARQPVAPISRG